MRIFQALSVAALMPMLVAAEEPLKLPASSKWVVEYADESCRLIRTFGSGDDQVILVIERAAPTSSMTMLAIGRHFKAHSTANDFVARFRPHERVQALHGQAAKASADLRPAVMWTHLSFLETTDGEDIRDPKNRKLLRAAMEKARTQKEADPIDRARLQSQRAQSLTAASRVQTIEISRPKLRPVVLESGSMGQAVQMMDACTVQQLRGWGIDPEVDAKIAKPPFASKLLEVLNFDDYPERSLRRGEQSYLTVRLLVDASGAITGCTPITPVAAEEFGPAVCNAMRTRAKFQPATLADGTPVPSYYIQSVLFLMPR